jgi:hypothetical protein
VKSADGLSRLRRVASRPVVERGTVSVPDVLPLPKMLSGRPNASRNCVTMVSGMSKMLGGRLVGSPVVGFGSLDAGFSLTGSGSAELPGSSGSAAAIPAPAPLINNAAMSALVANATRSTGFGTTLSFQQN